MKILTNMKLKRVIRGMSVADGVLISPASDCNSNNLNETSCVSNASSQDFVQDNSDYQWILDFGDREGSVHHHASILSSSYYTDDVALDFDANLAEVDMENFRREDINDFLHNLPSICCPSEMQVERQGEMFASISGSMMIRFDLDSSLSPHSSSQEESNESSICKSELLFSPVKDTLLPTDANYSVDSLDCGEQDMMLTCLANKDNYTIAFEGSTMMHGSDDYQGTEESEEGTATTSSDYSSTPDNNSVVSHNNALLSNARQKLTKKQQIAMTSSEALYTTWSKLKDKHSTPMETLQRHPSGNNNITQISSYSPLAKSLYKNMSRTSFLKSLSLPELDSYHQLRRNKLNAFNNSLLTSFENEAKLFGNVKIFNIQNRSSSESTSSLSTKASTIHYTTPQHKANFSLVKLFIEQKSASNYAIDLSVSSERSYWVSTATSKNDNKIVNKQYKISKSLSDNLNNKSVNKMNKINENDSVTAFEDSLMSQNKDKAISKTSESIALLCSCNEENDVDLDDVLMNSFSLRQESDPNSKSCQNINYQLQKMYYENNKLLSEASKKLSSRCPVHTIDRSMQTSLLKSTSPTSLKCSNKEKTASPQNNNLSKSSGAGSQDPVKKPVYIMYPNYTLPDLKFLKNPGAELDLNNVFLMPQKFVTSPTSENPPQIPSVPEALPKPSPFSCQDVEDLKKKGFSHVQDWESLAVLLPRDYCRVLADVPELRDHFKDKLEEVAKPLFCLSPPPCPTNLKRPASHEFEKPKRQSSFSSDGYSDSENRTKNGSFSSTATHQGSSGYRGSSTILSDSGSNQSNVPGSNPMFVYKYDSAASSDTSLKMQKEMRTMENERKANDFKLKSILRNASMENLKSRKNTLNTKRYSMFEFGDAETNATAESQSCKFKRRSLPEHFHCSKQDHVQEDEGIMCCQDDSEAKRLEDLLEISGGQEQWQEIDMAKLRAQVSHFLSQANRKSVSFNQTTTPLNSPNISTAPPYRLYQVKSGALSETPIKEEGESSPESLTEQLKLQWITSVSHKKGLIETVKEAAEHVVCSFQTDELDSVAQLVLNNLCPALYAVLSDGLKPSIETAFGDIQNSVWHVVETSAQQGPITKGLNELVLKLNSEDVLTEGLIKFNAFIFGLLNVHGLDAWFGYLRTRESLLSKHYSDEGLLLSACRSGSTVRGLVDSLISSIKPLADLPFKLDLLYECKQLHQSLLQLSRHPLSPVQSSIGSNNRTSWTLRKLMRSLQSLAAQSTSENEDSKQITSDPIKARPRSCVDSTDPSDVASTARKRWSGVLPGSKLVTAFQRLACEEDEYTEDSLEPHINNFAPSNTHTSSEDDTSANTAELDSETLIQETEKLVRMATKDGKFKRLQLKWEMLSSKDTRTPSGRLSTPSSPARSCGSSASSASGATYPKSRIPRPVLSPTRNSAPMPPVKKILSPSTQHSSALRKPLSTPNIKKQLSSEVSASKPPTPSRVSRADLATASKPGAVKAIRPSSLPYRNAVTKPTKQADSSRRIVSTATRNRSLESHKFVQTLLHRLPSDSGHLSFNEGEKLRLVLEVDEKWLLCCRGDQKGLVPRSAVIACSRY